MSKNLFADSDDNLDEEICQIKTNENYAKTYNSLRKKELLQKYKDKGSDVSESESDDSESSEEDEILDPTFDQDFLKTLASLKSKDPAIYDKNIEFFKSQKSSDSDNENLKNNINKENKFKPVTLKDYERKIILEKGGQFVDDSDEDNCEEKTSKRPPSPSIVEEERCLKDEFKKFINKDDDSGDEEFGGIFKKREKTKAEKDEEEDDYLKWLAGKKENIEDDVKDKLEPLKSYWSNDKLPSSEKFLRDYVLNKGYIKATNYDEIPTYEEIVGDQAPLSEDEQELEKQAEFEQKYNFRFEEPDQEFIKRYPRTIETSLRLTDEKRKKKRQEIKERKLQEKQQKLKDLEILKKMKLKEIQEKIEKLKRVTGNDELGIKNDDLEDDFDPDAHDRRMQELFNDEFYQVDEGEEKPECPSDIEELKVEDWDNYDPQQDEGSHDFGDNEPHCEDEDFNMDCEYDPKKAKDNLQKELIENTRKRRGGRKGRRDRFMEIIKSEKPVFNPEDEKTYAEYIDEYYKLDCEDIIGDIPCRFKYVETTPNDFGLTIEEILLAKNKELNQWASLKKAIQIRPEAVEKKEQRLYKMKSKNEDLKRKIFKSLYGEGSDNENEELEVNQTNTTGSNRNTPRNTSEISVQGESKKAKKMKKRKAQSVLAGSQTSTGEEFYLNSSISEDTEQLSKKPTKKVNTKEVQSDLPTSSNQISDSKQDVKIKKNKKNKSKIRNEKIEARECKPTTVRNIKNPFNKDLSKEATKYTNKKGILSNENLQKVDESKSTLKNNPFDKEPSHLSNCTKEVANKSLPPIRKNLSNLKKLNDKSNVKFKSKHKNKKAFNNNSKTKGVNENISDERLKAYGINPRKFHRKKKYGNMN